MARPLFVLLALALAGITSAKHASFIPRSHMKNALAVRGGAGPLDAGDTAKVATLLAGTHASLSILSPSRTLKEYGLPSSPMLESLAEGQGVVILAFCLQAYHLIVKGSDSRTAFTALVLPCLLNSLKILWNEDSERLGTPEGPHWLNLAITTGAGHAAIADASYLDSVMKLIAIWWLANGVFMALAPAAAGSAWGVEESAENSAGVKALGAALAGGGIFQVLITFKDMDPVKAFGYAWIPALLMQISNNFITKENDELNIKKLPSLLWMLIDAVVVATCAF